MFFTSLRCGGLGGSRAWRGALCRGAGRLAEGVGLRREGYREGGREAIAMRRPGRAGPSRAGLGRAGQGRQLRGRELAPPCAVPAGLSARSQPVYKAGGTRIFFISRLCAFVRPGPGWDGAGGPPEERRRGQVTREWGRGGSSPAPRSLPAGS